MKVEKKYRKVRCKTSQGYVVSWDIIRQKNGKWRIGGLGSARFGNNAVPSCMLPFALSNVVLGDYKPEFNDFDEAERYVRNI
jgi:hypothetical protein